MYPFAFFQYFPAFPRDNRVFVAMSFDRRFENRWATVIEPAIRSVIDGAERLVPFRVDQRTISDSILTEILNGVGSGRLIFADISTTAHVEKRPIRNANVMYEVGIAHASRLAEEVLLFRSDSDPLMFDLAQIRVNSYDPDNDPKGAIECVRKAIQNALDEVRLARNLAAQMAVRSLDRHAFNVLLKCAGGHFKSPAIKTMKDAISSQPELRAIERLLAQGLIRAKFPKVTVQMMKDRAESPFAEFIEHEITDFGLAVLGASARECGVDGNVPREILDELGLDAQMVPTPTPGVPAAQSSPAQRVLPARTRRRSGPSIG